MQVCPLPDDFKSWDVTKELNTIAQMYLNENHMQSLDIYNEGLVTLVDGMNNQAPWACFYCVFLEQEKATISVDGVNGPDIVLGSLTCKSPLFHF